MRASILLRVLLLVCLSGTGVAAHAADRMRPGLWVGKTVTGGRTFDSSSCISQADADGMNGDARSVLTVIEKSVPAEICKLSNVKVTGNTIVYSATCAGQPPRVITTVYDGTSSKGSDTIGTKSDGKLVGPCK